MVGIGLDPFAVFIAEDKIRLNAKFVLKVFDFLQQFRDLPCERKISSVLGYSLVYGFGIVFIGIVIWNLFYPWPENWWTVKFFITTLLIPGIIAVISTVWFMWGGIRDMRRLFIDLENRKADAGDNGQIFESNDQKMN